MKDMQEMTDRELLMELLEDKRRQEKERKVKYWVLAAVVLVIAVLLVIYIPKAAAFFDNVNRTMAMMETEVDNIKVSFDSAMQKIDELENSGLADLAELSEQLKGIDFDALGQMIERMNTFMEKLPILFN